jgi:hypothetical protein
MHTDNIYKPLIKSLYEELNLETDKNKKNLIMSKIIILQRLIPVVTKN